MISGTYVVVDDEYGARVYQDYLGGRKLIGFFVDKETADYFVEVLNRFEGNFNEISNAT